MEIILNNIYCKCNITTEDRLLPFNLDVRLRETLREKPDGVYFSQSYNSGWDGYIYFYTPVKKQFATGFLPVILKYCKEWGVKVTLIDRRVNLPEFKSEFVSEIGSIKLRPEDQIPLIKKLNNSIDNFGSPLYFPRGMFDAATNAGKTVMVLGIFKNIENPKMLFLTRRFDLFVQTVEFFEAYLGAENVGLIYSGSQKHPDKRWRKGEYSIKGLTIAMVTTLTRRITSTSVVRDLNSFNSLVVDECHYSTAKTEKKVIMKCNAGLRLFVSGTPFAKKGDKVKKLQLIGMSGLILGKIAGSELVERGVSRKVEVNIYLNHVITKQFILSYKDEVKAVIHTSVNRCNVIYDEIIKYPNKNYLVVYEEIAHGEFIYNFLTAKHDYNIPTILTNGKDKQRFEKVRMFLNGQVNVLIVNNIIREGINMPFVDTFINCSGGMSDIGLKQWIGRGLRTGSFNDTLKVIDFYDIGKHVRRHSKERLAIYKKEGYSIKEHFDTKEANKLSNTIKIK